MRIRLPFQDRQDAGRTLAGLLSDPSFRTQTVVLGLPRGGVPVAAEVAKALDAPLDVFIVRKLGVPGHEELAMGAIASGGIRLINDDVVEAYHVTEAEIEMVAVAEQAELERRERLYHEGRSLPPLEDHTVILVDDGLATGASMRAAVAALREKSPTRIVVAVPVASPETCEEFRSVADDIICAETPTPFQAVGIWYEDFAQTTDEQVHELLAAAR